MRSQFVPLTLVPWSHAATLTFSPAALRDLRFGGKLAEPTGLIYKHFVRPTATGLGLRIGAVSVFVTDTEGSRQHAHVLLIGQNAKGQTLNDFTQLQIAKFWRFGGAVVKPVDNIEGAVAYLERNCRQGIDSFALSGQDVLNRYMGGDPRNKQDAALTSSSSGRPRRRRGDIISTDKTKAAMWPPLTEALHPTQEGVLPMLPKDRDSRPTVLEWSAIRSEHEVQGVSLTKLARRHGIHRSSIRRRALKETWLERGALEGQVAEATPAEVKTEVATDQRSKAIAANERHAKLLRAGQVLAAQLLTTMQKNLAEPDIRKRQRISGDVHSLTCLAASLRSLIETERVVLKIAQLDPNDEQNAGFNRLCDLIEKKRAKLEAAEAEAKKQAPVGVVKAAGSTDWNIGEQ